MKKTIKLISELQKKGNTVCLVQGCFDIIHVDHLKMFQHAKRSVDYLVVGLESDEAIRVYKGETRPINKFAHRKEMLSELMSIDHVFKIPPPSNLNDVANFYFDLLRSLNPGYLITNVNADKYWKDKKGYCDQLNIKFIEHTTPIRTSTTGIIERIYESKDKKS